MKNEFMRNIYLSTALFASVFFCLSCGNFHNDLFGFLSGDNDDNRITSFTMEIDGATYTGVVEDSSVTVNVPFYINPDVSSVVSTFSTNAKGVFLDGVAQTSGVNSNDFSSSRTYTLMSAGSSRTYDVTVTNYGSVTTFAAFSNIRSVTSDGTYLYAGGHYCVRQMPLADPSSATVLMGNALTSGYVDGDSYVSRFNIINGLFYSASHSAIFVSDYEYNADEAVATNSSFRKIELSGASPNLSTLVGPFSADVSSSVIVSSMNTPYASAVSGDVAYYLDAATGKVYSLNLNSMTNTLFAGAGSGVYVYGTTTEATFSYPTGLVIVGDNIFISEGGSHRIRKISISSPAVSVLAGSTPLGYADGYGVAAKFNKPYGIATDGTNIYVCEVEGRRIRKIVISSGKVTTVAGSGVSGNDDGLGKDASFNEPFSACFTGNALYVADRGSGLIRKIQ